jgi:hypothetical protein
MAVSGQLHALDALPPSKGHWYLLVGGWVPPEQVWTVWRSRVGSFRTGIVFRVKKLESIFPLLFHARSKQALLAE